MGKIEEYAKRTQILVFAVLGSSGGLAPLPGHYPRIFCICRFFVRRFFGIGVGTPPSVRQGRMAKIEGRSAALGHHPLCGPGSSCHGDRVAPGRPLNDGNMGPQRPNGGLPLSQIHGNRGGGVHGRDCPHSMRFGCRLPRCKLLRLGLGLLRGRGESGKRLRLDCGCKCLCEAGAGR